MVIVTKRLSALTFVGGLSLIVVNVVLLRKWGEV